MEGEYEKIREQALQEAAVGVSYQPDAAEPEGAEQSVEAMPQKATDAEQSVEVALQRSTELQLEPPKPKKAKAAKKAEAASSEQPKEKPPRMICEGCGRSYSIHTKRHVCKAPKGFEKKENVPPEPVLPPMPVDLERQITLADVTQFLFAESKARREKRRDDLLAKMF